MVGRTAETASDSHNGGRLARARRTLETIVRVACDHWPSGRASALGHAIHDSALSGTRNRPSAKPLRNSGQTSGSPQDIP
jgi:hypothetical protein